MTDFSFNDWFEHKFGPDDFNDTQPYVPPHVPTDPFAPTDHISSSTDVEIVICLKDAARAKRIEEGRQRREMRRLKRVLGATTSK